MDRLWNGPRYIEDGGVRYPVLTGAAPDVGAGGARKLLAAPRMVNHHIFNVFRGGSPASAKYREFFGKHGIDIDAYAVEITEGFHRSWIHGAGRNWTTTWKKWIDANLNATTREVYQQAGRMMDEAGLSGLPIGRYK